MNLMNGVLPNGLQVASETVVMALLDKKHKKGRKIKSAEVSLSRSNDHHSML